MTAIQCSDVGGSWTCCATEAFWTAVKHVKPLSVGLNCSLGPDLMYPFLSELSEKADVVDDGGLFGVADAEVADGGPPRSAR